MYSAFMVNDPSGDPAVFLEIKYRQEALLFDLGDLQHLAPKQIRKIRHIFVSHAHMDHFIGFDHLLRICLGRDQHISLFGPPGFLSHVESKLSAYTWNLVKNYTNDFELAVTEIHETHRVKRYYRCRNGFEPEHEEACVTAESKILENDFFVVHTAFLDHSIPCLAFSFQEKSRMNIKKNVLKEMGLPTGPWINSFKEQIRNGDACETPVRIWWKTEEGRLEECFVPLGVLMTKAVKMTTGQKVTYITDAVWHDRNIEKMVSLASGSELLFIEAPFLDEDAETAARKFHLTARQAGTISFMAGVKRFSIFHFSPKYKGREEALLREAMNAFLGQ